MDETKVTTSAETTPAAVPTATAQAIPAKSGGKRMIVIILVVLGLLAALCLCCLGGAYLVFRDGDITLNGQCYKGLDNAFANKPIPCPQAGGNNPGTPGTPGNNGNPGTPGNQVPPTGTTPTPPAGSKPGVFVNGEIQFSYPKDWKVVTQSDVVIVTNPEGDSIRFSDSVEETGSLSESTCSDFADESLVTVQTDVDALADLVNTEVDTVGGHEACIFDIDTFKGGTTHLRYVYIVEGGRGYLVTLDATEDSSLQAEMLDVIESLVINN